MTKHLYKFLKEKNGKIVSGYDASAWEIGKWRTTTNDPICCEVGFHGSKTLYQAYSYVAGTVLAKVEVRGKHDDQRDKSAYQEMRIVQAWKWDKPTSIKLAIYAAELVIDIYEKEYPEDKRPREAIEAAKNYLANPSKKTAAADAAYAADAAFATVAAHAADAADAAYAVAAHAADAAAHAADAAYAAAAADAARAAADAARAAADAARAAADAAAADAAYATYAAYAALLKKINAYMNKLAKELEPWQ